MEASVARTEDVDQGANLERVMITFHRMNTICVLSFISADLLAWQANAMLPAF